MTTAFDSMPWANLAAVGIRTTGDGPFAEDLFWVFVRDAGWIEVPGSEVSDGEFALLRAQLPDLDWEKVVRASGSVEPRVFRLWHREESRYAPAPEPLAARFASLIARLGGTPARVVFDGVLAGWSEPSRAYHTVEHLVDCLREVDRAGGADGVELALWYHDVIYAAARADNEEQSARRLLADAARLRLPVAIAERAAALVRATAHASVDPPSAPDVDLLLDIDLSILGRDTLRFLEFDHGVAEEYAHVKPRAFRAGRTKFLRALLVRPRLFRTRAFHDRYEARARDNITALLTSPRYRA